jgi:glycosyltransferase involved in cell wall biosynthesis
MDPTVSVIIPAYNRASTILRAVQSVLDQTFQDFELIIVDDGSTDSTREIVESIKDPRIRLLCHEKNLGAAPARNTGMKSARGAYIAWLDSDDEWLSEKLEIQLRALMNASPDQKACYTAFERIESDISRIYIPGQTDYKKLLLECDQSPGATLLFHRSLLDDIGDLDVSMRRYEDWDWLLRYAEKYRFLALDQPLSKVHFSPIRSAVHAETSAIAFVSKYSEKMRQFGIYRNEMISRRWIEVSSHYAREHNLLKSLDFLIKGFVLYPFHKLHVWAWVVNGWLNFKIGSKLRIRK